MLDAVNSPAANNAKSPREAGDFAEKLGVLVRAPSSLPSGLPSGRLDG